MPRELISEKARNAIKSGIEEASGNEVFFVGRIENGGSVNCVEIIARGNEYSVPAVLDSAGPGDVVIHNHPSGNLTPSDQDIKLASVFGNDGVGFYIVNNAATHIYVVVEPYFEKEIEPLDIEDITGSLLPGGNVAEVMGDRYELRDEQLRMAESVARAFNDDSISVIEAGTGTGKTLSYLIPSAVWAMRNGERVVISTNTINLQEQLIDKDIPLVHKAFGEAFNYSLVKGMGNYLCLLRAETVQEGLFEMADEDEAGALTSILEWARVTDDGSLSDLSFSPPDEVWDKVSAESDSCLRVRCPYYSRCFFYKSRREIASSQLLVVNHHLLFSDLAIKSASEKSDAGILPPYKRVIFDEGHHITDAATSHFGMRATKFGIIRVLRRLKRKSKSGESKGLISYAAALASQLTENIRKGSIGDALKRVEKNLSPRVDDAEENVRESFDALFRFTLSLTRERDPAAEEVSIRVTESTFSREGWKEVDGRFSILRIRLKELADEIKYLTDFLLDYESDNDVAKLLVEFRGVGNKLDYYADVIETFLLQEDDGNVRWVEGREGRGIIISGLGLSPLDISQPLKERLYTKCGTVVMTSATMAVKKSFHFIKSGLGLEDDDRVSETILFSPFNYREQLLLAVPHDLPEPGTREYPEAICPVILEAVKAAGGNALILFTSYSLLDSVYRKISGELEISGIPALKQGALPRGRLLEKFRREARSVLFATDSFWEGVDVPGDALSLVIISRLPFRVPTEPIVEARVEHMEQQGINSFTEYSVPVAVLKFKQGFGRLIRTKTDRGAVLVLDRRIISKFYGRYFLDSLPPSGRITAGSGDIISRLKQFFSEPY